MSATSKKSMRLRKILFIGVLGLICLSIGLAAFHKTPWVVPLADKERKNPLTPSEANIAAARPIFSEKCANCHGDKGKGDGSEAMMYDPPPSDLTDVAKMSKLTDGEIFYQISRGRKPMPSFKKRLTEIQRWQLVLLVRSFATSSSSVAPPNAAGQPNSAKPSPPPKP
jgi:mono/diheme cytochrome c family protein